MIAISITTHENPRLIMEIASNVKHCYNNKAFLIVHVSADHKDAFYRHAVATGLSLVADNVFWNDSAISTKWGNTLPMQIWNYLYLKTKLKQSFSHFQILSPSNLVIKGNLESYVSNFDVIMRKTAPASGGWFWNDMAVADTRYKSFREANGLGECLCARVDGIAVKDEIFGEFVRRLLFVYSVSDLQNVDPTYPQEETILPTFLASLNHEIYQFGDAQAKTFEPNEAELTVAIVQRLMDDQKIAYLKRIAPQERDPVRSFILGKMSSGRS